MKVLKTLSFALLVTTWCLWGARDAKAFDENIVICDGLCSVGSSCCLMSKHPDWDTCEEYCGLCYPGTNAEEGDECTDGYTGWGVDCLCRLEENQ